jgi:hypothetical protein
MLYGKYNCRLYTLAEIVTVPAGRISQHSPRPQGGLMAGTSDKSSKKGKTHAAADDDLPPCQKLQKPFGDALGKFVQELQEAQTESARAAWNAQLDFRREAQEIQDAFLRAPPEERAGTLKGAEGFQARFAQTVQSLHKESAERAAGAYRNYLRDLLSAWAAADTDILNGPSLAAIAGSIQLAAQYAHGLKAND